jgi:hypothetical protein
MRLPMYGLRTHGFSRARSGVPEGRAEGTDGGRHGPRKARTAEGTDRGRRGWRLLRPGRAPASAGSPRRRRGRGGAGMGKDWGGDRRGRFGSTRGGTGGGSCTEPERRALGRSPAVRALALPCPTKTRPLGCVGAVFFRFFSPALRCRARSRCGLCALGPATLTHPGEHTSSWALRLRQPSKRGPNLHPRHASVKGR